MSGQVVSGQVVSGQVVSGQVVSSEKNRGWKTEDLGQMSVQKYTGVVIVSLLTGRKKVIGKVVSPIFDL